MRLDQIAKNTRISVRNLEALEEDRYEDLPADTFVRGYLKLLAKETDEDAALWLAAYDDYPKTGIGPVQIEENEWALPKAEMGLRSFSFPFRISHVLAVILAIVAFFLIYFALEGGNAGQTTTAERPEGSLIKMLDMRPVQRN